MPYVHCTACRLSTFTAAAHVSRDDCPRCGEELSPTPRPLFNPPDATPPHPVRPAEAA